MRNVIILLLLLEGSCVYSQLLDDRKRQSFTYRYADAVAVEKGERSYEEIQKLGLSRPQEQYSSRVSESETFSLNDECLTAIPLVINGGDYSYSNVGATSNVTDPVPGTWSSCTGGPSNNINNTVWFRFVVLSGPKNITVSSGGGNSNRTILKAKYAVYSGTCGALTLIGSSGTGSYGNFDSKRISLSNLAAGTYYIMTDGICSNTGTFTIRVDETPSALNTLWYPVSNFPVLLPGVPLTTQGQWGTYAADGPEVSASCVSGLQYSDWYKFTYDSLLISGVHVTDQAAQAAFVTVLYDASGNEVACNRFSASSSDASFTWDRSIQGNIPVHMPNIGFRELGLTHGATYYIRVSNSSATRYNVNDLSQTYTIQLGTYVPLADTYLNIIGNVVTPDPLYSWLTGQTNLRASQSMLSEPEKGNSGIMVENSLIYKFNTGTASTVKVNLQNITYYSYSGPEGQIAVLTAARNGTVKATGTFTGSSYTLTVSGLIANTDYWILIDGGGSYAGTKLTYDIAVTSISVLPIELLDFSVVSSQAKAYISWKTASEINNDHFTIERSHDGVNFTSLGVEEGAGNSNTVKHYTFTDHSPLKGDSYYRLKQTDFDGSVSYSGIKPLYIQSGLNELYPTFLSGGGLRFNAVQEEDVQISVYSSSGKKITGTRQGLARGENYLELDYSAFREGMYFIHITGMKDSRVYKVIVK